MFFKIGVLSGPETCFDETFREVLWKILQNLQDTTCTGVLLTKLPAWSVVFTFDFPSEAAVRKCSWK